ncbi:hypothetical protein SGPA1_10177 [Streptomyces misionensis JCM 4497]
MPVDPTEIAASRTLPIDKDIHVFAMAQNGTPAGDR